jgi:putative restriction endonuclease
MPFGIFIHRSDSIYDDSPAERYQFPKQYLERVQACVGSWVIYYEPQKVPKTRGYFAVAKVQQVIPDPGAPNMYLALIEPSSYLEFANPVAFKQPDGFTEQGLLNEHGRVSARGQWAVRPISPADFNRIVALGLADDATPLPRFDTPFLLPSLQEEPSSFSYEDRDRYLTSRAVRDRVFRRIVLRAYDSRCAITGLRLVNGAGRAEVEAAHIHPVEENGPDIVSNGLALTGTVHWMFDRGLISATDDLEILVSRQINDSEGCRAMINRSGRLLPPDRAADRPHPHFLRWHRENRFKA